MDSNQNFHSLLDFINENEKVEWGFWEYELPNVVTKLKAFDTNDWEYLKQKIYYCNSYQQSIIGEALGEFKSDLNDNNRLYGELFIKSKYFETSENLLANLVPNIGEGQTREFYKAIINRMDLLIETFGEKFAETNDFKPTKKWILNHLEKIY